MKKCSIKAFIIASVILVSTSVFADGIDVVRDIDNEKFTISGTAEKSGSVRAFVTAPGKKYSDALNASDPFDVIKYQTEFEVTTDDGSFSFDIELSSKSGVYKAYIATDNTNDEVLLEYVNPDNYDILIGGLNGSSDIQKYIKDNRDDLGFFLPLYDNVDKGLVCDLIEKKRPLNGNDIEECIDVFNRAVIGIAISEGDIDGVKNYSDKIQLLNSDSKASQWYKTVSAVEVDKKLSKTFISVDDFEDALCEAIVLSVIKNPKGYLNVKQVMFDFSDKTGIPYPTEEDRVYKELAGKDFASYSELITEYEEQLNDYPTDGNSGGGGGKGSGGNSVSMPIQPVNNQLMTPIVKKHFSDMENAVWAQEACEYLAEKGILSGKSEGVFAPEDKITREEFVTIIVRGFGFEQYTDNNQFKDLSQSDWCYKYVLTANQNGIIQGVNEDYFGKGQNITRQDMATILYRVIKEKGIKAGMATNKPQFKDEADISDYAKEAVDYLAARGVINGMDNGEFCGKDNALRAQAAQMIYKVLKSMEG